MAVAGMCLRDGGNDRVELGGPMAPGMTRLQDGTRIIHVRVRDVDRPLLPLPDHVDNIDSVGGAMYEPDDEGIEAELVAGVVE